jgi:hypothetical protein
VPFDDRREAVLGERFDRGEGDEEAGVVEEAGGQGIAGLGGGGLVRPCSGGDDGLARRGVRTGEGEEVAACGGVFHPADAEQGGAECEADGGGGRRGSQHTKEARRRFHAIRDAVVPKGSHQRSLAQAGVVEPAAEGAADDRRNDGTHHHACRREHLVAPSRHGREQPQSRAGLTAHPAEPERHPDGHDQQPDHHRPQARRHAVPASLMPKITLTRMAVPTTWSMTPPGKVLRGLRIRREDPPCPAG